MRTAMHALAGAAHGYGLVIWWETGNPCDWMWGALCMVLSEWMPEK